jgi:transposase
VAGGSSRDQHARVGRPSTSPERFLRAQLLQVFYSIRSERLLIKQLDYNLLFRWFVGMDMDEPIWVPTVFTKNRDRLLNQEIARSFFRRPRAVCFSQVCGQTSPALCSHSVLSASIGSTRVARRAGR